MNTYQLITRSGASFFVRSFNSDAAIRKIEAQTKDFVSCWFILGFNESVPKHATILSV